MLEAEVAREPVARTRPVVRDDYIVEVLTVVVGLHGVEGQQDLVAPVPDDVLVAIGVAESDDTPTGDLILETHVLGTSPLHCGDDDGGGLIALEMAVLVEDHVHGFDVVDQFAYTECAQDVIDDLREPVRVDHHPDAVTLLPVLQPEQEFRETGTDVEVVVGEHLRDVVSMYP